MAVKVLAVDDSKTMRTILEMTFAGEDMDIVTVGSGDEAVARARQLRPDVVFADASMDGMDGYAVSRAIKSELTETAVILMASQQLPYDEAKGGAAGIDDHVAKPFDSQVVIDKVAEVLAK
ncbi:MAG: response regulator, partial [Myxococcota bacterium]